MPIRMRGKSEDGYTQCVLTDEQREVVRKAIESHREAIELLEDEQFMAGYFESLEQVKRGERGVRLSEIKRKPARARRVSA
jgi:hypothetical protein